MARLREPQRVTRSPASSSADENKVLPKDWVVESKTQKNGKKTYKCYIDPVTSRKFYSVLAVNRYLEDQKSLNGTSKPAETSKSAETSKPAQISKPAQTSKQSQTQVQIERRVNVDGLPEKWILEIVSKKVGGKTRKDPFYIDPETGYAFRSKPDALRYLKSGDIEKCAIKPKIRDLKTLELINEKSAPPATESKKLEVAQCSNDSEPVFSLHNVILESEYESKYGPIPGEEWADPSSIAPLEPELIQSGTSKTRGQKTKKLQSKKGPVVEKLVSTPAQLTTAAPSGDQLVENGVGKDENGKTKGGLRKRKEKKELDTPRRASKRVAGVPAETSSLPASQRSSAKAKQVISPTAGGLNNSTTVQVNHPEVEATGEGEGFINNCVHQLDGQPNSCAMPVANQAGLEKLGAGNNIDDKAGSSITLPFVEDLSVHDYLQDPCLEFAFKTLTGAIPVDDNLLVPDYLQQQVGSPQTQNTNGTTLKDIGVGDFETDNLFQFDEKVSSETQLDEPTMKPVSGNQSSIGVCNNAEHHSEVGKADGNDVEKADGLDKKAENSREVNP